MSGVIHGKFHLDVIFLVGITSVFTREPPGQLRDIDGTPIPPMTDIKFTSPGVEKPLQNLNPNKAADPDLLPTRMLKEVAKIIASVLPSIFQQS
jgi:hypothetical protein